MANHEYIEELRAAIGKLHGCDSKHAESVPVNELFQGKTAWKGVVEVFDLIGHPKAKHCYAWNHLDGDEDEKTRYVTVLEIPPISSPVTAVMTSIMADAKASKTQK